MENRLFLALAISLLIVYWLTTMQQSSKSSDVATTSKVGDSVSLTSGSDTTLSTDSTVGNAPEDISTQVRISAATDAGEMSESTGSEEEVESWSNTPWATLPDVDNSAVQTVRVTSPLYQIEFSTQGGMPRSWKLTRFRESFSDPRYLQLRVKRPINISGLIVDPRDMRGWLLPLGKRTTLNQFGNRVDEDYWEFHSLNVDHLAFRELMDYQSKSGREGQKLRGGLTEEPVSLVRGDLTWPYAGFAGEWGGRPDETILYQANLSQLDVQTQAGTLTFTAEGQGFRLEKSFVFYPDRYTIDVIIRFVNETDSPIFWQEHNWYLLAWRGGLGRPSTAYDLQDAIQVGWGPDETEIMYPPGPKSYQRIESALVEQGLVLPAAVDNTSYAVRRYSRYYREDVRIPLGWAAVDNKYFAAVILPNAPTDRLSLGLNYIMRDEYYLVRPEAGIPLNLPTDLQPHIAYQDTFKLFVGPKELGELEQLHSSLPQIASNTWFSNIVHPISKIMLSLLGLFYKIVPNYGVGIVMLTLLVKILLLPLYHKQMLSMKKMQALSPQINALKEQYKNDPQRLQKETMEFYRRNKINPAAGCLMILPTMPIMIALWITFNNSIELRGAPFVGWITDLSKPDGMFFLPLFGWIIPINILPIIYALAMFWSQSRQQVQADNPNAQVMKMIPFIFVFVFWNFASGVVLYFVVSVLVDTIQRLVMDALGVGNIPVPAAAAIDSPAAGMTPAVPDSGSKDEASEPNPMSAAGDAKRKKRK